MADLPIPSNARDVGECIYCGAVSGILGKEHAIPYGLNGPWTLLRASCGQCADITHRFERDTLQSFLLPVRTVLSMQTRRPKKRPTTIPLVLESKGKQWTIHIPPTEFPLYLPTLQFPPPGILAGAHPCPGISTPQIDFLHLAGPTFEQVLQQYSVDFVGARLNFSPQDFARTIAKIAFTAAVYVLGVAPFSNTPIRRVILGEDPCVGHWVGSWIGEPVNEPKGLHALKIRAAGSDLHVFLRLFAQFNAPEYHVVLGPADPDFVKSEAWPLSWR
jgi:hypothetical protein